MNRSAARRPRRRWFAPEVVQSSTMDCGPASLKCLLEGFGIPVSYGRLREACQTSVDGTSIDTIETVANSLGLRAEQVMIPVEHVSLDSAGSLPALLVVRHSEGPTHFVVVWRRVGQWLQVMDPAIGRRWIRCRHLVDEVFRHEIGIFADEWRSWAGSEEFLAPLRERLADLGADRKSTARLVDAASADAGWFSFGALDASARLVGQVVAAGGMGKGSDAVRLLETLFQQTRDSPLNIFAIVPPEYWSVSPNPDGTDPLRQALLLRGAVLLRVDRPAGSPRRGDAPEGATPAPLSPELAAALGERQETPLRSLWGLLREDGILAPLTLAGAMVIAAGATLVEALLFRGLFDIGTWLTLGSQRLAAVLGLLAFMGFMLAFQIPIIGESIRFGRRLDARLRMALLRKLPRLTDRYFHSRPVSDMAERSHSIHLTRLLPGMGIHFVKSLCELGLTLAGIALLDPHSGALALLVALLAICIPAVFQPVINERDLRVRNHSGALTGFYLDSLLGLVPIRAHRAQRAVRHQHESLLVEWARSSRRLVRASTVANGLQSVLCLAIVGTLLVEHFVRSHGVTGADLLLIYWALKLPAIGASLTALAHQYPMQRNVLLRLLEPLAAPDGRAAKPVAETAAPAPLEPPPAHGVRIDIAGGAVVAAGHTILRDLDLSIGAGEHVAIVGLSGAGKSTMVGLLLGWHRPAAGSLRVDGRELTEDALVALRRETAWVDPAIQIWNTSFLDNLAFGAPDADLGRTASAIDDARLRGVLQKLPHGLQTPLGEGGTLLSGGEGQRVRLARALVQSNVRLALLDEPFRGMDRQARIELLADARRRWRDATMICVTHDVGETRAFDRVLVIEDGRILEDGPPASLAARPSRYRQLLHAEKLVRERTWKGKQWRHLRLEQGALALDGQAAAGPPGERAP
ncbi:MAG: ATP-binding cassette domain-containing protein [Reyranellaceae bacterium]